MTKKKLNAAGFADDYEVPADKDAAKKEEDAKSAELSKYDRRGYEQWVEALVNFKKNFNEVQKFINDKILQDFDNCEFYTAEDGELGSCMIIPAKYVGEEPAPTFFLFTDGIREKKE